ncbi:MAG: DNA-binding response regulator [Bacteroidia bacterium]|nr:MAG: DNA-binding response regulator [Bacteroidia bacterium]
MSMIKVLVVDNHQIVRDGIFALLTKETDMEIVGELSTGEEVFEKLESIQPDVIIMDIDLPNMSGIDVAMRLKREYLDVKVIMFSSYTDAESIFNSIQAGVKGFLPKNSSRDHLVEAIRTVHKGMEYMSEKIPNTIVMEYIKMSEKAKGDKFSQSRARALTDREKQILTHIAEGHPNREIGKMLFISARTVETHKNNILRKLELRSTIDLVKFAIKNKMVAL